MSRFRIGGRLTVAVTACLLATSLAACGSESKPASPNQPKTNASQSGATTPKGSESDKKLTLYSGRDEKLVQPLIDQFTKDTGIKVEVRYGSTSAMAAQLIEEGAKSPAQVFLAQDAGALAAVSKAKLFTALPATSLDKVAKSYQAKDGSWVGVTGRVRVLAYNRGKVPASKLPASVFDLVKPEWKGKVGVAPTNASFQAFVTAMRVQHGKEKTMQWLKALKANDPQIREKNGPIVKDVTSGTLEVGLVNNYYIVKAAKEAGKSLAEFPAALHFFGNGDIGGLINVSGLALVGTQPDSDAQTFIDYMLSPKAQEYFRDKTGEYPLVKGVSATKGMPALDTLKAPAVDLNDLEDLQTTVKMISEAGLS